MTTSGPVDERYGDELLGAASPVEDRRLAAMQQVCDGVTVDLLRHVGIADGWRCFEVGAGGGSIARWMAEAVAGGAAPGEVVATDLDLRHLHELGPHVRVLRHDVVHDPIPGGPFDLVHARFLLEHLREREHVIDRLVSWLAPGGWLVVESIASFPARSSPDPSFRAAMVAVEQVLAATMGTDSSWARGFPSPLASRGLEAVDVRYHLPVTGKRNPSATCWSLTLEQLRPRILELGLADVDVLDRAASRLADPAFSDVAFATVAMWGRAPSRSGAEQDRRDDIGR